MSLCFLVIFLVGKVKDIETKDENGSLNMSDSSENNLTYIIERFKTLWPVKSWEENGYFTDEYIANINTHWLKFGPPNVSHFVILGIIYLIIKICGAVGNALVISLFVKCKSLRTPANTLVLNLALSDGLILTEAPIFMYNCYHRGPVLGEVACQMYGFVGGLSGTVSIITLSAISFDRFFVIKFPLQQSYSSLRVKICLVVIWFYGAFFSLIPVLDIGLGRYTYEGYLTSCSFDYLSDDKREKIFIIVFFVAAWVVPLVLIVFCYSNIIQVVVRRASAAMGGKESFRHVKEEENKKQEVKIAILVFSTICLWFLAWTPYAIVALLGIYKKQLVTPLSSMIPAVFCKIASCINPFVYALSHPKFKSELKSIFNRQSVRMNRESRKVWASEASKSQPVVESYQEPSCDEVSSVEEIEVAIRFDVDPYQASIPYKGPEEMQSVEKIIKRQSSKAELLCLQPNFSNKSSALRKATRRFSRIERERRRSGKFVDQEQM